MSLTCTHLGCMVEPRNFGFECPCHGSRYSADGTVVKGPAASNLPKTSVSKSLRKEIYTCFEHKHDIL